MTPAPETSPLDGPSIDARRHMQGFVIELARFGQALDVAIAEGIGDAELTANLPMMVLMELDTGGPRRPRELQRLTGLSSVQVTRLVDRLVERGVVSRATGGVPGDGRATVISLTPEGERVAGLAAVAFERYVDELRANLRSLLAHLDEAATSLG